MKGKTPFPLEEVFSPTQRQYLPKGMDTLEDVALASSQDILVKKNWEYIASARRYLARNLFEKINREGEDFLVKERPGNGYSSDYRSKLYKAISIPFIEVWNENRISYVGAAQGVYRYHVKFENDFERQSFERFSKIEFEQGGSLQGSETTVPPEIPLDLFDSVVGYEDAKDLFNRSLHAEKPVHILLIGPPASAKTVFLLEIERLKGSAYALGGSSSKAGLADLLFNRKPTYLLIDEIDKLNHEDYSVLLSLCENGIVAETKYGKLRETKLNTTVYAAANNLEKIPEEVRSRFLILKFPRYLPEQYRDVVKNVLIKRERVEPDIADHIAQKISKELDTIDVRDSIKVSRLASTKEDVERVLASISKYY